LAKRRKSRSAADGRGHQHRKFSWPNVQYGGRNGRHRQYILFRSGGFEGPGFTVATNSAEAGGDIILDVGGIPIAADGGAVLKMLQL